jgi:arsenite-transporting ATPase
LSSKSATASSQLVFPGADSSAGVDWTGWGTRFVFFTGKGGVGKTTVAAASAIALADRGRRVLMVCTDPASNLDDVLEMEMGLQATPVPGVPRLSVMNIDPESAASAYRERVIAPYRGRVPSDELRAITEQLSGQCTMEVAAFDEFARLLSEPNLTSDYDHVVFDTAPTGHTLRLLSLPSAWSGYLATSTAGASCLGPLGGLEARREEYTATVQALADPVRTTLVLVARAEFGALAEAARAGAELARLGIQNQRLLVNAVLTRPLQGDLVADDIASRQRSAITGMPVPLRELPTQIVPLVVSALTGPSALRDLVAGRDPEPEPSARPAEAPSDKPLPDIEVLVQSLAADGHGVVMVMGKGGVGKTRIATDIAIALARLGHRVHLSTTDPAGDPAAAIGSDRPATLSVDRIDPALEVRRYTERKLAAARDRSREDRALLEEDLRSPCTEEIAVFAAFSRLLGEARDQFVVLDTAPTGHTLLLLDTTGAYHREVLRTSPARSGRMTTPLMRLQDSSYTKVLVVTLAETTPVQEAAELQVDLRRAGVEPYGWVVNATLSASGTRDPLLMRRATHEQRHLRRVREQLARRVWQIPWQAASEAVPAAGAAQAPMTK